MSEAAEVKAAADKLVEMNANDLARQYLLGELMATAMRQLRAVDKPWLRIPEEAQRRVIKDVETDCRAAVNRAVEIIASDARTRFKATVESVTFKDGVKAVLTMGNTEASHELADVAGGTVLVVIEDPMRYTLTSEKAPKPDANQTSLITEDVPS